MNIDMGWKGPLGTDVTIKNGVVFVHGTNHWLEWLHHVTPFAGIREKRWADQLLRTLSERGVQFHTLAGHSIGGTVVTIAALDLVLFWMGRVKLYTYGAKRPPRGCNATGKHYRIKGDVVPFLPPWRKALPLITLDYGKMGPIEAHGPRSYWEQMEKDGVR